MRGVDRNPDVIVSTRLTPSRLPCGGVDRNRDMEENIAKDIRRLPCRGVDKDKRERAFLRPCDVLGVQQARCRVASSLSVFRKLVRRGLRQKCAGFGVKQKRGEARGAGEVKQVGQIMRDSIKGAAAKALAVQPVIFDKARD